MNDQMVDGQDRVTEGCPMLFIFFQAEEFVKSLRLGRVSPGYEAFQ